MNGANQQTLPPIIWVIIKAGTLVTLAIILLLEFLANLSPFMPGTETYFYAATGLMVILSLILKSQHPPASETIGSETTAENLLIRDRRSLLFSLIVTEGFLTLALANYLLVGDLIFSLILCACASLFSRAFFPKPSNS